MGPLSFNAVAFCLYLLFIANSSADHDHDKKSHQQPYYDKKLPYYEKRLTYQLTFPDSSSGSYVELLNSISSPLDRFSLCYWARPHTDQTESVFSYSVDGTSDEIWSGLSVNYGVSLKRGDGDPGLKTPVGIRPDEWVHVCITWSSISGKAEVYLYGKSVRVQNGVSVGRPVRPGGVVVFGQSQTGPGVVAKDHRSWRGDISELQLWDYVLNKKEVSFLAGCTLGREGNVISWFRSKKEFHHGVQMSTIRLPCKD